MATLVENAAEVATIAGNIDDAIEAKGVTIATGEGGLRNAVTNIGKISTGGSVVSVNGVAQSNNNLAVAIKQFYGDTTITSAVTDVAGIGESAFQGCTGLTSIDLKNVTTLGTSAFQGCTGLTSIDLKNVTTLGTYAFQGCTGLTSIDLDDITTCGLGFLRGCTGISGELSMDSLVSWSGSGDIGCFIDTRITKFSALRLGVLQYCVFNGCTTITEVYTPSVTEIGDCGVRVPNIIKITTGKVTTLGSRPLGYTTPRSVNLDIYTQNTNAEIIALGMSRWMNTVSSSYYQYYIFHTTDGYVAYDTTTSSWVAHTTEE